jgi:transcriptional regulator with AAA-type ATPase domain/pSer/pThr/pTyr-binding forkhead associated (FHA) protein
MNTGDIDPHSSRPYPEGVARPLMHDTQATVVFQTIPPPVPGETPSKPSLEVLQGKASPREIFLGREKILIGRANTNDLVLQDGKVSRTHAEVFFKDGLYYVQDLNSTNGVSVNDQLVQCLALKPGIRILLGDTLLQFKQREPEITLKDKVAFLNRSDLFNTLDEETRLSLAQNLTVRFFPPEALVSCQGTLLESMFFLYSGKIRVAEINEEGGEKLIAQLKPGDFFGERALLAGEPNPYSMITGSDCLLLELQREKLNALFINNPDLNKTFYRMVFQKLQSAQQIKPGMETRRKDNLRDMVTSTDVEIIGENRKIQEAKKKIEELASKNQTALIIGPPGTGKKTFARYYHKKSAHPDDPYMEISLSDLEENQVGSVLFGIESDPGATHMKGQIGYLEMIETGTLAVAHAELLDVHQQSKLATYLKYGWFHRVYGQKSVKSKTRLLLLASGTEEEVLGRLIPELKELLQNKNIFLPPLSQRLKDIPILAGHFLKVYSRQEGRKKRDLSRVATEKLVSYNWPGNIKELDNVIQRAAIVSSEDLIIPGDLIFVSPSEKETHKINILRNEKIRAFLTHPMTMKTLIWFNIFMVTLMAGFTLYAGLFRGPDDPLQQYENNLGMVITWIIWFPVLPLTALLVGRIWCGMCPIAGIGDLAAKVKRFNLPVPNILKRLDFWLVVFTFLILDYLEEFLDIAGAPIATGTLLIIIIGCSALFCVLYERKTFCRYVCPLAGLLGAYSTLSPVEVRGNKKICQTQCGQHHCLKGSDKAEGCPMFSYPASLDTNAECMMCFNCLKSCDQRGVQVNLRPPLQELWRHSQPLLSLAVFGVMLVGLMAHHQFMEGTYWKVTKKTLETSPGLVYTLLYLLGLAMAVVPFWLSSTLSAAASQETIKENMARYGMAFIPLALAGHLSHIGHEFLDEGLYEIMAYLVMVYNYFTSSIPIGSVPVEIPPFIHSSLNTFLKVMIILSGAVASMVAMIMIARRFSKKTVFSRILPHFLILVAFFIGYLYIFTAPTGKPKPPPEPATQVEVQPQTDSTPASNAGSVPNDQATEGGSPTTN